MMAQRQGQDVRFLEQGDIYFAYRPRVEHPEAKGVEDIQRLYVLLQPEDGGPNRRLVLARKMLPEEKEHERIWGFVDEVGERPEEAVDDLERETYETRTRGTRVRPEARPAAEGKYGIIDHGDHTHLVYEIELPPQSGEVQEELNIEQEGSYILAVKNPETPSPSGVGLAPEQKPDLPKELLERFGDRRFAPAWPELLNVEKVEFIMIGAAEDPRDELGIDLDEERETLETADIFRRLRMPPDRHPVEPLTEGEWR